MAEEQMSLEGILHDEKPAPREPAAEPAKEPAAEAPAEPKEPAAERPQSKRKQWADKEQDAQGLVRDPATGQFVAKEEPAAEPPKKDAAAEPAKQEPAKTAAVTAAPQELNEKEKAFLRGMQEERAKRQDLERRLAAIEAGKTPPAEPAKTFWDSPDEALAKHRQEIEQVGLNTRLQTAEMIARSRHPDFDEKVTVFRKILNEAPGGGVAIATQWLASPDPAMFAYNVGKNHMELQQAGNLDALRAQIEKETEAKVRSKVEAEMKAKAEALEKERAALPGSLSDARSSGVNRPVWGGPPPLDDVLKF